MSFLSKRSAVVMTLCELRSICTSWAVRNSTEFMAAVKLRWRETDCFSRQGFDVLLYSRRGVSSCLLSWLACRHNLKNTISVYRSQSPICGTHILRRAIPEVLVSHVGQCDGILGTQSANPRAPDEKGLTLRSAGHACAQSSGQD